MQEVLYSRTCIFTFYLFKAEEYTSVSTTAVAPTTLLLVIPGNQDWLW